jgi:hypothetical protein
MLISVAMLLVQDMAVESVAHARVVPAVVTEGPIETLAVRVSSPEGVLWQGTLRVGQNQSGSYSQSLSQASADNCPPNSPYDRSERSSLNFNVYVQNYGQGRPSYRVDASWGRPIKVANCGESGTRTVQINQGVMLEPGQTATIKGDSGFRVELTRTR